MSNFFSNNFFSKSILGAALILCGSATVAQAGYNPPDAEPPTKPTVANGSRTGCLMDDSASTFTAIAPMAHLGRSDRQPELFFYVPVLSDYRLDVGILDDTGNFVALAELEGEGTGISSVTIPEELTAGIYEIQAGITCDGFDYDARVNNYIEIAPDLAFEEFETAELYADEGYWYDAFALADTTQKIDLLRDLADLETGTQQSNLAAIAEVLELTQQSFYDEP